MTREPKAEVPFEQAVAGRSSRCAEEVVAVLARHSINPAGTPAPASPLRIVRIGFTGTKVIDGTETPIDFSWDVDRDGVWGVLAEDNLVGKSSILQIALRALRGRPKSLTAAVRRWIETVDVAFRADGTLIRVAFVGSVLHHGFHPSKARHTRSIHFTRAVRPEGPTPKRGPYCAPLHTPPSTGWRSAVPGGYIFWSNGTWEKSLNSTALVAPFSFDSIDDAKYKLRVGFEIYIYTEAERDSIQQLGPRRILRDATEEAIGAGYAAPTATRKQNSRSSGRRNRSWRPAPPPAGWRPARRPSRASATDN